MQNGSNNKSGKGTTNTDEPGHIDRGSGNVFTDLKLPDPDIALAKAELVQRIRGIITSSKLTQAKAAELLGMDQPKVSSLICGRVEGYSIDRLFRILNSLGQRIEISIHPSHDATDGRALVVT